VTRGGHGAVGADRANSHGPGRFDDLVKTYLE
jgi:hypothetical protein